MLYDTAGRYCRFVVTCKFVRDFNLKSVAVEENLEVV
jgi:hypothetical protein